MGKEIAAESVKTQKVREKLRERLSAQEGLINERSLAQMIGKIRSWIASHKEDRIRVNRKVIQLFDQNQNAAKVSSKVQEIASRLHEESRENVLF